MPKLNTILVALLIIMIIVIIVLPLLLEDTAKKGIEKIKEDKILIEEVSKETAKY